MAFALRGIWHSPRRAIAFAQKSDRIRPEERGSISLLQFDVGANGIRPVVGGVLGYYLQN